MPRFSTRGPKENRHRLDGNGTRSRALSRRFRASAAGILLLASLAPQACFFRRNRNAESRYPTAPIRIALLPPDISQDGASLQWTALASLVLMSKVVERAPDLEAVPLWEMAPVALESLRSSRNITPEIAAFVASRLGTRWSTRGEIAPAGTDLRLRLEFIPSQSTMFPFRYEKEDSLGSLNENIERAFVQFLRYLIARPLSGGGERYGVAELEQMARAVDREYGWFVTAEPGQAGEMVQGLAKSDTALARFLFNPALYPILAEETGRSDSRDEPPR